MAFFFLSYELGILSQCQKGNLMALFKNMCLSPLQWHFILNRCRYYLIALLESKFSFACFLWGYCYNYLTD